MLPAGEQQYNRCISLSFELGIILIPDRTIMLHTNFAISL